MARYVIEYSTTDGIELSSIVDTDDTLRAAMRTLTGHMLTGSLRTLQVSRIIASGTMRPRPMSPERTRYADAYTVGMGGHRDGFGTTDRS